MKVGTGGNLGLSREYHKKLFGPLFYPWWNCPLTSFFLYVSSFEHNCIAVMTVTSNGLASYPAIPHNSIIWVSLGVNPYAAGG